MQLEVILAGNRVATKPPPSKRVKPGIKKKPRWRLENGVLVQTPKHPKHYSGYTYIITMDRFLVEQKCAASATGTIRTKCVGLELKVGSPE